MSISVPPYTQILVVGAGPVGLTCAISLLKQGHQVTIVEAVPLRTKNGCKASVLHAHTLSTLDSIGCLQPIVDAGTLTSKLAIYDKETRLLEMDLEKHLRGTTAHPFMCLIPQHSTENVLEDILLQAGVKIYYGKKVVAFREVTGGIEVTFDNGESTTTQYLVGADGSRSTIRRLARIDFVDPKTGEQFDVHDPKATRLILADIHLQTPYPKTLSRSWLTGHFCSGSFMLLNPVKSTARQGTSGFFRTLIVLRPNEVSGPAEPDKNYVQTLLDSRSLGNIPLKISKLETASRWVASSAVASQFVAPIGKSAYICLVGDAAHVHSPAGAQGINLGICDAVALSEAITSHSKSKKKNDKIFETYSVYRRQRALEVEEFASGMTNLNAMGYGWKRLVRNATMTVIGSISPMAKQAAIHLSGIPTRDASKVLGEAMYI